MSESVKLDFTGDPAGLVAAIKSLQTENAKLKAGFEETSKAGTKGYAEQKAAIADLSREAAKTLQGIKTEAMVREENLRKLRALHTMGKLDADQYALAVRKVHEQTSQNAEATDLLASATGVLSSASAAYFGAGAIGWAAITLGISTAKQSMADFVALQEKAASRNITAGQAMESLAFNAGGDMSTGTLGKMIGQLRDASRGTLLSNPDQLMAGAASAISSIAESDPQLRADKTVAIARAVRAIATDRNVAEMMSTTAQLGQVSGAKTEDDYRRSLALASAGMSMANITDAKGLAFMARAGSVSLANSADGVDREKVMKDTIALWAATTVAMKDRTGEASATAVGDLSKSLREFTAANAIAGKTDMERLAAIRANPALAEEFKGKVGGGQAAALFQKLLDPKSEFAQAVAANQAGIAPNEAALEQIGRNMRLTPQQRAAEAAASIAASEARQLEGRPELTRVQQARQIIQTFMEQRGTNSLTRGIVGTEYDIRTAFGQDPVRAAAQVLEDQRFGDRMVAGANPERDAKLDTYYQEMIAELRKLNDKPPSPLPGREEGAN